MNSLQCEVCQQQISAETASQPEASLVRANEAAEMLHLVYVHCVDCKQYLCKPCDYKVHQLKKGHATQEDAAAEQDGSVRSN